MNDTIDNNEFSVVEIRRHVKTEVGRIIDEILNMKTIEDLREELESVHKFFNEMGLKPISSLSSKDLSGLEYESFTEDAFWEAFLEKAKDLYAKCEAASKVEDFEELKSRLISFEVFICIYIQSFIKRAGDYHDSKVDVARSVKLISDEDVAKVCQDSLEALEDLKDAEAITYFKKSIVAYAKRRPEETVRPETPETDETETPETDEIDPDVEDASPDANSEASMTSFSKRIRTIVMNF